MKRSISIDCYKNINIDSAFEGLGDIGKINLSEDIPCIVNNDKGEIMAVPGITGSKKHKTNSSDKNLVLEIANFDADKVAMASFNLNHRSQSSKIYSGSIEKKLSKIALIKYANHLRGKGLIKKILKYKNLEDEKISFEIDLEWISDKISSVLSDQKKQLVSEKISLFGNYENGTFTPNQYYNIIKNKYDLLQELIRLIGFDEVVDNPLCAPIQNNDTKSKNLINRIYKIKEFIASMGFNEVITRPFVQKDWIFNEDKSIKIVNPNNETKPFLSDNLHNRLLDCYNNNLNLGEKNLNIFEINSIFRLDNSNQTEELSKGLLVFETNDEYKASSIANKLFEYLYSRSSKRYDQKIDIVGKTVLFENQYSFSQVSKKNLKIHGIPLSKKIWIVSFDISVDLDISEFKKYSDENQNSYIKRVVNFDIDPNKNNTSELKEKLTKSDQFDISFDIIDIYKGEGKTTVSVELIFNSHHRNITNQEVDEYIKEKIS